MAMASKGFPQQDGRQLGVNEVFYDIVSKKHGLYHYYIFAVLKSNCRISKDNFNKSVQILVNFQPLLRMEVVTKTAEIEQQKLSSNNPPNRRFYFEPCDVYYDEVIRYRKRNSDDDLEEIMCEEDDFLTQNGGYGEGPRWRIVFDIPGNADENIETHSGAIYHYKLFFRLHHQIVDGVSGYDIVYRQLLPILNNIINGLQADELYVKPLDLTPSYEEEILGDPLSADKKPAWYARAALTMLRKINRVFQSNLYNEPLIKSKGAPFSEEQGVGIVKFTFGKDLVDRILYERKMQDVTVHSILLTVFSFAVLRIFDELDEEIPKEIKSGWPIDSRKKLPKYKSPLPLGIMFGTSGITSLKTPSQIRKLDREVFWNKAEDIGKQVLKHVQNQHERFSMEILKYWVEKLQNEDFKTLTKDFGLKEHFWLSNLGKCTSGPEVTTHMPKTVDVEEVYFGFHGKGIIPEWIPFFISAVFHKGEIFFGITYKKAWIKRDLAEKFSRYAEEIITQVCK